MASLASSDRREPLGALLILGSAFFFSLTGVLTKSIGADAWTIVGWRGFVGGVAVLAYVVWSQRGSGRPLDLRLDRKGWAVAGVSAVAGYLFIEAFKLTSVAHVTVIYATVPFMTAAIALLALRERLSGRTLLASIVALLGVGVTVSGSGGASSLAGDAIAVFMTFLCAVYLVMVRAFHDTPTVWASGMAAFLLMIPSALLGDFSSVTLSDAALMTFFGLTFAAAIVLWTEGARLIPSPEAGLLGAAEIPLAIVLAWLFVGEAPRLSAFIGGAIVIAALGTHLLAGMRAARREAA